MPDAEVLVVADGAREDPSPLAAAHGSSVIDIDGPRGPAVARNIAAQSASGDLLMFVDADVVVMPHALPGMAHFLTISPEVSAVFGAYDHAPVATNFISQFRNLYHAYVHEASGEDGSTFWSGLGAIRASAFYAVGGFDERFSRPSVEDIDLGYRLCASGHRIRLDTRFRGGHLKRWSLRSSVSTDILDRGVPWTQLVLRFGVPSNALNVSGAHALSAVTTHLLLLAIAAAWYDARALALAGLALGIVLGLNLRCYRWFARVRGLRFAVAVVPAHLLHHLCNGLSFALGCGLALASACGLRLPGALHPTPWTAHTARVSSTTSRPVQA
jgi:hypothetical protein